MEMSRNNQQKNHSVSSGEKSSSIFPLLWAKPYNDKQQNIKTTTWYKSTAFGPTSLRRWHSLLLHVYTHRHIHIVQQPKPLHNSQLLFCEIWVFSLMGSFSFAVCVSLMLLVMVVAIPFELPKNGRRIGRLHRWWDPLIRSPVDRDDESEDKDGVRWAVLVAGSNGYGNYRHQVLKAWSWIPSCKLYCKAKEKELL